MEVGNKVINIVVIGEAGDGKSTLCNTLTGNINVFKESNNSQCETKETIGLNGNFDQFKTFIIDTPGMGDPDKKDSVHIVRMIEYVKKYRISVILLVLDSVHPRLLDHHRRLLELFYSLAPGTRIHHHLAIVWTKWVPEALKLLNVSTDKSERKNQFYDFIKSYLKQIPENEIISIPQYFIDSYEAREKGSTSQEELKFLLAWAYTKDPIQKLGVPLPKILNKNNSKIHISLKGKPYISLIGDIGSIDEETSYNLNPDELPIDVKLLLKRELIIKNNNYFLVLTSKDSSKKIITDEFILIKNKFSCLFGKNNNIYYPIYLYNCSIPNDSNYYICKSLNPKIVFLPFTGEYEFLIADFSTLIRPSFLHINFQDKEGKIYEVVTQQISFLDTNISLPGRLLLGPLELKWEHNHINKMSNCFVITENGTQFYKNVPYILIETGKEYTEGLWNQTHIKDPDKYQMGNGEIYATQKIIKKDPMPLKPTAPFACNIFHDGDKSNGYNKGRPWGWKWHEKGEEMEKFRMYGKGWSYKYSNYHNWGDTVLYSFDRNKDDNDRTGKYFVCTW